MGTSVTRRAAPLNVVYHHNVPETSRLGRGRVVALIGLGAVTAVGFRHALLSTVAQPKAAAAAEPLRGGPEEASVLGVAILALLVVAIIATAVADAWRRHSD